MKFSKNKINRVLRIVHRDLGFLMVGICLIYGISGILLNHMKEQDPAYKTEHSILNIEPNLTQQELEIHWNDREELPVLRKVMRIDEDHYRLMLEGGMGVYNAANGNTEYEISKKRLLVYWINKLHYNKVKGWSIMADLFAVSLIFFAVSGLFIVSGKKGIWGRGKWFVLCGLLIPVLYIILS